MKHTIRTLAIVGAVASLLSVGSVFASDTPAKAPAGATVKTTAPKDEAVESCKHQGLKGKELNACIQKEHAKMKETKKGMNKPAQMAAPSEPAK